MVPNNNFSFFVPIVLCIVNSLLFKLGSNTINESSLYKLILLLIYTLFINKLSFSYKQRFNLSYIIDLMMADLMNKSTKNRWLSINLNIKAIFNAISKQEVVY